MNLIIGVIVVVVSVFGGFVLSKGNLLALWHPPELMIIGGAALGAFIIANPPKVVKSVFANLPALLRPAGVNKALYLELLSLLYTLFAKARKNGLMALEADIEQPHKSPVFRRHPRILANAHVMEFLVDYLRMIVSGTANAMELENLMDLELDTHHEERTLPAGAVTQVSDGLPGFGIVAAVLGIVITMNSLAEGPEVIGAKVAAALVGTFLGILMAYGLVAPMGHAMEHRAREEGKFMEVIKVALLATLNGYAPQLAVEFGRKVIYSADRPSFAELEKAVKRGK